MNIELLDAMAREIITLKEQVAFLESREVCGAAHENVETCGFCQRDSIAAKLDAISAELADVQERRRIDLNTQIVRIRDLEVENAMYLSSIGYVRIVRLEDRVKALEAALQLIFENRGGHPEDIANAALGYPPRDGDLSQSETKADLPPLNVEGQLYD